MEINKLLDECMLKIDVQTDYQLAKKIGLHSALISMYRNGKRIPDALACFKIAEILGMDEKCLIAHFEAQGAKNPVTRDYWTKKAVELGGIAASFIFTVTFIVTPTPTNAAPVLKLCADSVYYVKCNLYPKRFSKCH